MSFYFGCEPHELCSLYHMLPNDRKEGKKCWTKGVVRMAQRGHKVIKYGGEKEGGEEDGGGAERLTRVNISRKGGREREDIQ